MNSLELKDLIDRYLKNNVTDQERNQVEDWYQSYNETQSTLSPQKDQQLKADIYGYVKEHLITENAGKPVAKIRRLNITRYAAAAAVIIFISAGLFIRHKITANSQKEAFNIITTGVGQVKKIKLPDSSTVWLNAKTRIRVSEDFDKTTNRSIYLDDGEAFFEVAKNPARPFLVITSSITTRVLGTSFNVKAYRNLHNATVTVKTGRVQVSDAHKKLAVLLPNQKIIYSLINQTGRVSSCDAAVSKTWAEGNTELNSVSFDELANAIKNIYGVKLKSANKLTNNYQYDIVISSSHTLDETMRIICSVHHNKFRRNNNNEIIIY
jgi:transmembrane sensor